MPRRNRIRNRQQLSKKRTVMGRRGTFLGGKQAAEGVKLEPLVKADGRCYNAKTGKHKIAFNTEEKAALALSAARTNHQRLGHTERIEQRYYLCPIEDRGGADREHYHLTHKEERPELGSPEEERGDDRG